MTGKIHYDTELQIKALLKDKKQIDKLYPNRIEFVEFLKSVLSEEKYDLFSQAEIAGEELRRLVDNEFKSFDDLLKEVIIDDMQFLQTVLSNCLKRAIEHKKGFDWFVNSIYLKNIEYIEAGRKRVKMTASANKVMFDGIWKYPKSYFSRLFIRYAYTPPSNEFVFDPFIFDYFGDIENLNEFLMSSELVQLFNDNQEDRYFYDKVLEHFYEYLREGKRVLKISDSKELLSIKKYIDFK